MSVGDIRDVGLDQLHALSIAVGWPHRAEDWQFLREIGRGIVAVDEIGRVLGSAMWFPYRADFSTVGMVITSPRLQTQGTGQWLMRHVFSELPRRDLRLNATRAARRLYLSLNFKPEKMVFQCQGTARLSERPRDERPDGEIKALEAGDLDAVIACDAAGYGVERAILIRMLFEQSSGYGLFRDGQLCAFAFCRPFGRGHVVGPAVASNDTDAIAVVAPHVAQHAGHFLRLDTHQDNSEFATFLSQSGMPVYDTVLTMSLGKRLADFADEKTKAPATYALASQALG
ncbi:GNAT family N-acetyltransferase [Rhizobium sp. YTU87027]|uniref:GNAT family N-acetyltransferase n=1 Tax=Rhizobium sp. YTU87027 TaxID=3417741 RepID=UPI003D682246